MFTEIQRYNIFIGACIASDLDMIRYSTKVCSITRELLEDSKHKNLYHNLAGFLGKLANPQVLEFLLEDLCRNIINVQNRDGSIEIVFSAGWYNISALRLLNKKFPEIVRLNIENFKHVLCMARLPLIKFLREDLCIDLNTMLSEYEKHNLVYDTIMLNKPEEAFETLEYLFERGFTIDQTNVRVYLIEERFTDENLEAVKLFHKKIGPDLATLSSKRSLWLYKKYCLAASKKILEYYIESGLKIFFEASD